METLAVRILRTIFSRGRVLNEGETLETDAAEAQELLKNGWAQPADGETADGEIADTKPEKGKKNAKPKNNGKDRQPENSAGGTDPNGAAVGDPAADTGAPAGENGENGDLDGGRQPENPDSGQPENPDGGENV